MKRMAENPVTNELREFMKNHTGRHVWAHKVNLQLLETDAKATKERLFNATPVAIFVSYKTAGKIMCKKAAKIVKVGEAHNKYEDRLVEVRSRIEKIRREEGEAYKWQKDLTPLNAELRKLEREEENLRGELIKTNEELPGNHQAIPQYIHS